MKDWFDYITLLQNPENQELEDTGFFCPVSGKPLMRAVHYSNNGETAYIVEDGTQVEKIYLVDQKYPYFRLEIDTKDPKFNPQLSPGVRRHPSLNHEISYWLITPEGWKRYTRHTSWKLLEPVFLPYDLPQEDADRIIDEVSESQFPIATNWAFPIIQQVAAKTIGLNLVSVQPMSAPSGILSYLDPIYGRKKSKNRRRKSNKRNGNILGGRTRVYVSKGRRRRYNPALPFLFKRSRMERTHKRRTCCSNNRRWKRL